MQEFPGWNRVDAQVYVELRLSGVSLIFDCQGRLTHFQPGGHDMVPLRLKRFGKNPESGEWSFVFEKDPTGEPAMVTMGNWPENEPVIVEGRE